MNDLPPLVRVERDALVAEIEAAFDGVSREGGVSWSTAAVADACGAWPLEPEHDMRWQDLVDDLNWKPSPGLGGFAFLDAIGFRYYLPVQMTRCVRDGWDDGNISIGWRLGGTEEGASDQDKQRWSLLDLRQRLCVKRFLQYMNVVNPVDTLGIATHDPSQWQTALDNYWNDVPDEPTAFRR